MATHVTRYETKDGKTRRVNSPAHGPSGAQEPEAAPKTGGADNPQTPDKPAKQGV
jgi:hypothetical protein